MFDFSDIFGVTTSQVNDSNKEHAINFLSLVLVLVEKGILLDDELETARAKATHLIDQEWARKTEKANAEFRERFPYPHGLHQYLEKLLRVPGENHHA